MYIARKALGQHFLEDQHILQKIVQALHLCAEENYVEIGPGLGALTRLVLSSIHKLTVIEYDKNIIPHLQNACRGLGELNIQQADVLKVDFTKLADRKKLNIFGNLPYNISTPILFHLIEYIDVIEKMLFMLQKEVVERIVAKPDTHAYGRLSVMVQYYCMTEQLFTVPPNAFRPAPKVDSAVVRLIPRKQADLQCTNTQLLAEIVKQAFQQRRKTIRNSLKKMINDEDLISLQINPTARAENLTVKDYVNLTNWKIHSLS